MSISGYHIREAGSTAVQELAFTMADGLCYVEDAVKRGLDVDDFAPRLSFFWNIHNDFLEEVAKLRAARRMWARLMKERFGAKNPRSMMLRTHAQTAGASLTAQQPINNVVRVAIQALAGVMGGVQSLHTNSMDETLALPTEQAVMVALRTQQIIAEETGVTNTIDPLGGSYAIEALTDRMEREAMDYIRKIDEMGGMLKAIETGYPQREIAEAAFHYQRQLEKNEKTVVGVNKYSIPEEIPIETLKIDPADGGAADPARAQNEARAQFDRAAERGAQARRRGVPLGRKSDGADLRGGAQRARPSARSAISSAPSSACTPTQAGFKRWQKRDSRIMVAKPGLDGHDRGAKIIARALRDGGFEVIYTGLHQTPEMIAEAAVQEDADAVGLSVLSGAHMTLFPEVLRLLKERAPTTSRFSAAASFPTKTRRNSRQMGVRQIFTPGASTEDIVKWVRENVHAARMSARTR